MDLSVSLKDQIWFLHVCHHVSNVLYRIRHNPKLRHAYLLKQAYRMLSFDLQWTLPTLAESDLWLTVHRSSMWNKKPTRCHLVLYLFRLYKLLFMSCSTCFGPPCAHLQELTTWWYFFTCGVVPWLCRQSDLVGWLCVHWGVRSITC